MLAFYCTQKAIMRASISTQIGMLSEKLLVEILIIAWICYNAAVRCCKAVLSGGNGDVSTKGAEEYGERTRRA
jgi:hypothetical protein